MIKTNTTISSFIFAANKFREEGDEVTVSNVTYEPPKDTEYKYDTARDAESLVEIKIDGGVTVIVDGWELKTAIENALLSGHATRNRYREHRSYGQDF